MPRLLQITYSLAVFLVTVFSQHGARRLQASDVDEIVKEISRSRLSRLEEINANSLRGRQLFAASDRAVQHRESLKRPIFGRNSEEAKQAALVAEIQAAQLSHSTGMDSADAFDANGTPRTQEIASITTKAAGKQSCIFDRSNTDPCTSEFREHSGRCSHVEEGRRTWGMAGTPYIRILPNRYQDGVQEYRTTEFTSNKKLLPSTRKISETVTDTARVLHEDCSTQVMQWGQFIAHEFTLIGELEEHIECCPDRIFHERRGKNAKPTATDLAQIRKEIHELRGHACIAIENERDTVYGGYVCMDHTRSTISPTHQCSAGPRQQANLISHLMDGSAVYGSSKRDADQLRSFRDGKLAVQVVNGHTLPPSNTTVCPASVSRRCPFMAGDIRINDTPNLASIHTVFIVAHNKFATELKKINSHWDDERLYQETRRIIAAIESSIHYNEYLPLIIGNKIYSKWISNYDGYKPSVNPSVLNEMAGAAMRFGHSLIEGNYPTIDDNGIKTLHDLEQHFNDHDSLYKLGPAPHLRGILDAELRKVDGHIPKQMRNRLFKENRDIIALNINRGRDHGFASYVDYRRHYGLSIPRSWNDMRRTHPSAVVNALEKVYTTVGDVELYIGGLTENPVAGGLVGKVFANILGDGFSRLRDGDRLFYASSESGLTPAQIAAIDQFSLAQLLCVGGDLTTVSRNAFFHEDSARSQRVQCATADKFDFDLWREDRGISTCHWQTVDISRCCRGQRSITRKCIGKSRNCKCRGNNVLTESCSCPSSDFICIQNNLTCLSDSSSLTSPRDDLHISRPSSDAGGAERFSPGFSAPNADRFDQQSSPFSPRHKNFHSSRPLALRQLF